MDGLSHSGLSIGDVFRLPHIQEQFAAAFRVGAAGELAQEIDCERVIANWEMPIPSDGWDWKGEI
jgi:hypothetical protein